MKCNNITYNSRKIVFSIIIIAILLSVFSFSVSAQRRRRRNSGFPIEFRAAGLGIGWYNPAMDYWNDESMIADWSSKFDGSTIYLSDVEFYLYKPFFAKLNVGYWTEKVKANNVQIGYQIGNQDLQMTLIPADLTFLYELFDIQGRTVRVITYGGLGGSYTFIQKRFNSQVLNADQVKDWDNGSDFSFHATVGQEYTIRPAYSISAELSYHFGSYVQQIETRNDEISTKNVSLSGIQVSLILKYSMASKDYWRRGKFYRR